MLHKSEHFLLCLEARSQPKSFDKMAVSVVDLETSHGLLRKSSDDELSQREEKSLVSAHFAGVLPPCFENHFEPESV